MTKRIKVKPLTELMVLREPDRKLLASFVKVGSDVHNLVQENKLVESLNRVEDFISDEVSADYLAKEGKRLDAKDEAAWYTMWSVGLGLLKLLAPIIPNVSEEFYQQYFRDREGSPSIHSVAWPEPFSDMEKSPRSQERPQKKSKGSVR